MLQGYVTVLLDCWMNLFFRFLVMTQGGNCREMAHCSSSRKEHPRADPAKTTCFCPGFVSDELRTNGCKGFDLVGVLIDLYWK